MRICLAPAVALAPASSPLASGLLRKRFRKAIGPVAGAPMSNLPMRVSFITSLADMAHTIASQASRRACSEGRTGKKWSSMNSMVAMTMSPCAMSALHRSSALLSSPHSAAACTLSVSPGIARASVRSARAAALARWLSIVTSTTRTGV